MRIRRSGMMIVIYSIIMIVMSVPSQTFNQNCNPLTSTNTSRSNPKLLLLSLQLMHQMADKSSSRCTEGMSKCDGASIHIKLVSIKSKIPLHCNSLGRKCFIDFDQINIIEIFVCDLQQLSNSWSWSDCNN